MTDPHAVPLDASDEPTDFVPAPMFPPTFAAPPVAEWPRPEPVVTGVEPPDEVAPRSPAPKAGKTRAAAVAVVALGLAATGVFYLKGRSHPELAAEPAKEKSHDDAKRIAPQSKATEVAEPEAKPAEAPKPDANDDWAKVFNEARKPSGQGVAKAEPVAPLPTAPVLKETALPQAPQFKPEPLGSMDIPALPGAETNRAGGPEMPAFTPDVVQAQAQSPTAPSVPVPPTPAMPAIPDVSKPLMPITGPVPSGPKPVEPLPKLPEKTDAPSIPALPKPGAMTLPSPPKTDAVAIPSMPPTPGAMTLPVAPITTSPIEMKPAPLTTPAPDFKPAPTSLPPEVTETKPSPQTTPPVKTELFNEVKQAESPQPAPNPAALPQPPALPALDFPPKPTLPAATPARETVPADPTVRRAEYEVNLVSVRRGDSYDAIAKDSLGDAKYGELLRRYNNDRELRPGEVVKVPPAPVLRKLAGPNWTGAPDAAKPAAPRTYTTARDGMSMWDIAYEVYGTKAEFRKVIDANRDRNPNLRYRAGERFRLPGE